MPLGVELALDIVDREIPLAQGHDQLARRVASLRGLRAVAHVAEEAFLQGLLTPELVAQDPKGPGGITKTAGDLCRGEAFDEIGAQGLVLTMEGVDGLEEEASLSRVKC